MTDLTDNIENTLSVNILHYLHPKCFWTLNNCINQSSDQRLKKEKEKPREVGLVLRPGCEVLQGARDRHLTGAAEAICVTRTPSCPGPSKSLSPHLIHPACCPLLSLLIGTALGDPPGTELWMEGPFPRGGSGPFGTRESEPPATRKQAL